MATAENKKRLELVKTMLVEGDLVELVSKNPKRISNLLGFCETGDEMTQLIGRVFELFKGNEKLLEDVLKVISGVLAHYNKRTA